MSYRSPNAMKFHFIFFIISFKIPRFQVIWKPHSWTARAHWFYGINTFFGSTFWLERPLNHMCPWDSNKGYISKCIWKRIIFKCFSLFCPLFLSTHYPDIFQLYISLIAIIPRISDCYIYIFIERQNNPTFH